MRIGSIDTTTASFRQYLSEFPMEEAEKIIASLPADQQDKVLQDVLQRKKAKIIKEPESWPCETCDKKCDDEEGQALLYGSYSAWLCADCYAKEAPDVLELDDDKKSANSSTYGEGCRRICRKCGEECSCWNYNDDHEVICEDCEGEDTYLDYMAREHGVFDKQDALNFRDRTNTK